MSKIVNLKSLSFETILFKINKIEREEPTKIGYQKILNFLDSTLETLEKKYRRLTILHKKLDYQYLEYLRFPEEHIEQIHKARKMFCNENSIIRSLLMKYGNFLNKEIQSYLKKFNHLPMWILFPNDIKVNFLEKYTLSRIQKRNHPKFKKVLIIEK